MGCLFFYILFFLYYEDRGDRHGFICEAKKKRKH